MSRDVAGGSWRQSAAERQIEGGRARYGLKAWANAMTFFTKKRTEEIRKEQNKEKKKSRHSGENGSWVDSPVALDDVEE